jgi:hypothetical protein
MVDLEAGKEVALSTILGLLFLLRKLDHCYVVQEARCAYGDIFDDTVDEMFVNTFLMAYVGPFGT